MAHPQVQAWLAETAVSGEDSIHAMRSSHGVRVFWTVMSVGFGYSLLMAVYRLDYTLPVMLVAAALLLIRYAMRWRARVPRSEHRFDLALQCFSRMAPLTRPDRAVQLLSSQNDRWSVRIQTPGQGHLIVDVTDRDERIRTELTLWVPFALSSLDVERLDLPRVLGQRPTGRLLVTDERSSLELVSEVRCSLDARRRFAQGDTRADEGDIAVDVAELVAYVVKLLDRVHDEDFSDTENAILRLTPATSPAPMAEPEAFECVLDVSAAEETSEKRQGFVRGSLWMRFFATIIGLVGLHLVSFLLVTSVGKGTHDSLIFVVCATIFVVVASYLVLPMPPRLRSLRVRAGRTRTLSYDGVQLSLTPPGTRVVDLSEPVTCTLTRASRVDGEHVDVCVALHQTSSGAGALSREEIRLRTRVLATPDVQELEPFDTTDDDAVELPDTVLVERLWPLLRRHVGLDWELASVTEEAVTSSE